MQPERRRASVTVANDFVGLMGRMVRLWCELLNPYTGTGEVDAVLAEDDPTQEAMLGRNATPGSRRGSGFMDGEAPGPAGEGRQDHQVGTE